MIVITCPYCGENIYLSESPQSYEWLDHEAEEEISCPRCRSSVTVALTAAITSWEITESEESLLHRDEAYEAYCESKLDVEREES